MPDLIPGRRWTRRSVLALGVASAGVLLAGAPAYGAGVTVGDLAFTVPDGIRPVPTVGWAALGVGWQWRGRGEPVAGDDRTAPVVLARADLASTDPQEVTGLLLAGAAAGAVPGLELGGSRVRSMPGGGDQTRIDVAYAVARSVPFHGTVLIATREQPPAAVLVVVGAADLTAGTIDGILDSARWRA